MLVGKVDSPPIKFIPTIWSGLQLHIGFWIFYNVRSPTLWTFGKILKGYVMNLGASARIFRASKVLEDVVARLLMKYLSMNTL